MKKQFVVLFLLILNFSPVSASGSASPDPDDAASLLEEAIGALDPAAVKNAVKIGVPNQQSISKLLEELRHVRPFLSEADKETADSFFLLLVNKGARNAD